jgi:hypothetical protein
MKQHPTLEPTAFVVALLLFRSALSLVGMAVAAALIYGLLTNTFVTARTLALPLSIGSLAFLVDSVVPEARPHITKGDR